MNKFLSWLLNYTTKLLSNDRGFATISKGKTFGATESVTNTKLHALVDDGTVTGIVNADIDAGADIDSSKIDLSSSGYMTTGANLTVTGTHTYSTAPVFSVNPVFSIAVTLPVSSQLATSAAPTSDADIANKKYIDDRLPSGVILMWSGSVLTIPTGWLICDGTNSTPNLTDRFVIHADNDVGGTNNVGASGGVSTHALSIAELAAHTHSFSIGTGSSATPQNYGAATNGSQSTTEKTTGSTGSGTAHTNRDKYYALAYIMKS